MLQGHRLRENKNFTRTISHFVALLRSNAIIHIRVVGLKKKRFNTRLESLYRHWLVFIQLLGNGFQLSRNPERPWKHENKDGNLSNESTAKAICHTGSAAHSFSRP